RPCPARSSATTSQPVRRGASKVNVPALSSQPCRASTRRSPLCPHTSAASLRPPAVRKCVSVGTTASADAHRLRLLLERRAAEPLRDELLHALLLLVEARARQQQHPLAGRQACDDLAVREVGQTRLDSDRHGLITAQRNDPIVAAEQILRRTPPVRPVPRAAPRTVAESRAAAKHSARKRALLGRELLTAAALRHDRANLLGIDALGQIDLAAVQR